jgi:hypothetical protein
VETSFCKFVISACEPLPESTSVRSPVINVVFDNTVRSILTIEAVFAPELLCKAVILLFCCVNWLILDWTVVLIPDILVVVDVFNVCISSAFVDTNPFNEVISL